jgi:nucleoside-diphosphate-sugar epimerase
MDHPYFKLITQDICIPLALGVKFDYIIHAASNTDSIAYATDPVGTIKANVLGCVNLLEYARQFNPEKFLFMSSYEVYGQNDSGIHGIKEDYYGYIDCTNLRAAYPESKRISEALCVSYYKEYGIKTVMARPAYIYGPITNKNFLQLS